MPQIIPPLQCRKWVPWIIVLLGSLLIAALPFFLFRFTLGTALPAILPQVSSDTLYYLKQMREVMDGHPWLGSPFIREYADARFPGLLLPIWMGAVPGIAGLSINGTFVFNTFFYGVLTGGVLYKLCLRFTQGNIPLSAGTALVGVLSLHNLLIRPVLQIVYPAFAAFLLCLLGALEKPHNPWRYLWLGLISTFAFYLYPHLWMPEFAAIGLLFLRALHMRDGIAARWITVTGIGIALACLPQILNIIQLFSDPMAKSLNFRTGLVETHRVLPLTLLNLKYIFLLVCSLLLVRQRRLLSFPELTLLFVGSGILAAALSNVVTGKEMDFDTHPLWISFLLNAVAIAVFALPQKKTDALSRVVSGMLLCAFIFTTTARTARNTLPYLWRSDTAAQKQLQDFRRIFIFLQDADIHESVILAPNMLRNYIPIYSDNYVFYDAWAYLHVIPDDELLERFLVQYVDDVTEDLFRNEGNQVAGFGPGRALHYRNAYGGRATILEFIGGEQFIRSTMEKHRAVQAHHGEFLRKHHVDYAITDVQAPDNPRVPADASVIYHDERFTVYQFAPIAALRYPVDAHSPFFL